MSAAVEPVRWRAARLRIGVVPMLWLAATACSSAPRVDPAAIASVFVQSKSNWSDRHGPYGCRATFRSDGTAELSSLSGLKLTGEFTGQIDRDQWNAIVAGAEVAQFDSLADNYDDVVVFDASYLTIRITRGTAEKTVVDYAQCGPANLVELERLLWRTIDAVEWKPVSK